MFFGVTVKLPANQAKPITLASTLKLTQAVLEPVKKDNGGKEDPICLMAEIDKKQLILCVLDPSKSWQSPLDLYFEGGSRVKFFIRGKGTVHLTGYENFDDLDDMSMSMSDEEVPSDEEVQSDEEDYAGDGNGNAQVPDKKVASKNTPLNEKSNGLKVPKRRNAKDQPKEVVAVNDDDDDDDESDDEDFDADDLDDDDDDMDDEDMSDEDVDEIEDSSELESDDE